MKVLVIGGGGREHALCWKLRQSPLLTELYAAPGNPGIARIADVVPIAAEEIQQLADFATDLKIDLTIVGPELPLTLGLVDEFRNRGLRVFGPQRQAAELEGSKVFAKEFMRRHEIPTADFQITHDAEETRQAAAKFGFPVVVKADGLAAGKGVYVIQDRQGLEAAIQEITVDRRFGASGDRIIVEECLEGEEASFIVLSDGERMVPLATSKDYKRLLDDDEGPNTGGMGSHSPAGVLTKEDVATIWERVLRPTIRGMAEEGRRFVGVLYAGLMITPKGLRVLEFNARFGDPEIQSVLLRIKDDLLPTLIEGADGQFTTTRLKFHKEAAVCIVLGSQGYPNRPTKGEVIVGEAAAAAMPGVEIFHSGTDMKDDQLVTNGGRVLNVCATGLQLVDALKRAYAAANEIRWPSRILRRDIGRRVLASSTESRESGAS